VALLKAEYPTYTTQLLLAALVKQSTCTLQLFLGAPLKAELH